jgi:hypothetical protein
VAVVERKLKYDILQYNQPLQGSKRMSVMVRSEQGLEMQMGNTESPDEDDSLLLQLSPNELRQIIELLPLEQPTNTVDRPFASKLQQRLRKAITSYELIRADWVGTTR